MTLASQNNSLTASVGPRLTRALTLKDLVCHVILLIQPIAELWSVKKEFLFN